MVEAKGKKTDKQRTLQFLSFLATIVDENYGNTPPPTPPKKTSAQTTREISGKKIQTQPQNFLSKQKWKLHFLSYLPQ